MGIYEVGYFLPETVMNKILPIQLFVFTLFFVFLHGCHQETPSEVKTLSNYVEEFNYVIEGSLQIPAHEEPLLLAALYDLQREIFDHQKDPGIVNLKESLSNPEELKFKIRQKIQDLLPAIKDHKAIEGWVKRQIKYSWYPLASERIVLTLDKIISSEVKVKDNSGLITIDYVALCTGIQMSKSELSGESRSLLSVGYQIPVPQDVLGVFYQSMGSEFIDFYHNSIDLVKKGQNLKVLDNLERQMLMEKSAKGTRESTCIKPDGDGISPLNFFYYYNQKIRGCKTLNTVNLTITDIKPKLASVKYPEYQQLFKDGQVDIFVLFSPVGQSSPGFMKRFVRRLSRSGYRKTLVKKDDEGHISEVALQKTVGGIRFNITSILSEYHEAPNLKLKWALGNDEIIIYNGHSGYGQNIERHFTVPELYPANRYQIVLLNGCSSYAYGVNSVLAVKDAKYIDVITTYDGIKGEGHQMGLLKPLETAARAIKKPRWSNYQKKSLSWLGIITKINRLAKRISKTNSPFLVSGEHGNEYVPGMSFDILDSSRPEALEVIVADESKKEMRGDALDHLVQHYEKTSYDITKDLPSLIALCHEAGLAETKVFYGNCQLKRLFVRQAMEWEGFPLKAGEYVSFYEDGKVKSFVTGAFWKSKNFQITDDFPVEFWPNGNLKSTNIWRAKDSRGYHYFEQTEFYPSGHPRKTHLIWEYEIFGVPVREFKWVTFYENERVQNAILSKDYKQGPFTFVAESSINLYPSGRVHRGILAADALYKGQELAQGEEITLSDHEDPSLL